MPLLTGHHSGLLSFEETVYRLKKDQSDDIMVLSPLKSSEADHHRVFFPETVTRAAHFLAKTPANESGLRERGAVGSVPEFKGQMRPIVSLPKS